MCVDLAHAAVPGLVAVAGLLDSPQGEWVLSVREGLPDKLQVLAAVRSPPSLHSFLYTPPSSSAASQKKDMFTP